MGSYKLLKDASPEELRSLLAEVSKSIDNLVKEFSSALAESRSTIRLPTANIPKFELPPIQRPKIPEIDFDTFYREFEEECRSNAKYGWALPQEIDFRIYRKIGRSEDSLETRDALFKKEFEDRDSQLYRKERDYIIDGSSKEWKQYYIDCFDAVENGKLMIAIPSLMAAVEGELTTTFGSDKYGRRLIEEIETMISQKERFTSVAGASFISLLRNGIFLNHPFTAARPNIINRNWVLHGRDDPTKWTIVDVYKIMTVISTVRFLGE